LILYPLDTHNNKTNKQHLANMLEARMETAATLKKLMDGEFNSLRLRVRLSVDSTRNISLISLLPFYLLFLRSSFLFFSSGLLLSRVSLSPQISNVAHDHLNLIPQMPLTTLSSRHPLIFST